MKSLKRVFSSYGKKLEEMQRRQERVFLRLVNSGLKDFDRDIAELKELSSGVDLYYLIRGMVGKEGRKKIKKLRKKINKFNSGVNSINEILKRNNCQVVLQFLKEEKVDISGISSQSLAESNVKTILAVIWVLVLHYQIRQKGMEDRSYYKIMKWVNSQISQVGSKVGTELSDIDDWKTGSPLYNLIHATSLGMAENPVFKFNLQYFSPKQICQKSLDYAEKAWGIPKIMNAKDFVHSPDELTLLTFVSCFKREISKYKRRKEKERKDALSEKRRKEELLEIEKIIKAEEEQAKATEERSNNLLKLLQQKKEEALREMEQKKKVLKKNKKSEEERHLAKMKQEMEDIEKTNQELLKKIELEKSMRESEEKEASKTSDELEKLEKLKTKKEQEEKEKRRGYGEYGEFGDGAAKNRCKFTPLKFYKDLIVTKYFAEGYSLWVFLNNGKIIRSGWNSFGQLGNGTDSDILVPLKLDLDFLSQKRERIVHLSSGNQTALLSDEGRVYVCGRNNYGQLGLSHQKELRSFTKLDFFEGKVVTMVVSEVLHLIFATKDCSIYSCGRNYYGQLGLGDKNHRSKPTKISLFGKKLIVEKICVGGSHPVFLTKDQGVFSFGSNSVCQCGMDTSGKTVLVPTLVKTNFRLIDIEVTSDSSVFVEQDGSLHTIGTNFSGQCALGHFTSPVKKLTKTKLTIEVERDFLFWEIIVAFHLHLLNNAFCRNIVVRCERY